MESCDIIDDSTIVIGADNKGIYILRERSVRVEECVSCKNIKMNALYSSGTLKLEVPPQVGLPASIEIFTIDGKRIYSTTLNRPGLQTLKIPLASGVYLLVLKGKNRYAGKFVSVK